MRFLENFNFEHDIINFDNLENVTLQGVLDFETCATDKTNTKARVWASGIIFLDDIEKIYHQDNITDVMEFLRLYPVSTTELYIHNLGFDIRFIMPWLLKYGFTQLGCNFVKSSTGFTTKSRKKVTEDYTKTFELIEAERQFYQLTINWVTLKKKVTKKNRKTGKVKSEYITKTKRTILRDSYKKVSSPLSKIATDFLNLPKEDQKGEIDYEKIRLRGYKITEDEKYYLFKDCNILARLMITLHDDLNFTKLTASSQALYEFIDLTFEGKNQKEKKEGFREVFPLLDPVQDNYFRRSYRGGWTYADPRFKNRYDVKLYGKTYDVTSLYPSVMYHRPIPFGKPEFYEGEYVEDENYPLFIQRLRVKGFKLKKNYLPTIQIKNNRNFKATEYLENNIVDGCFSEVELILTSVDLNLFFKHYKVQGVTYIDGYKFKSTKDIFKKYVTKWIEVKNNSEGVKRSFAKILLNGLYGKFATRCVKTYSDIYIDEKGLFKIDNSLENENVVEYYEDSVYTPASSFITAYAREFTITSAQINYKYFMYADTDSIHLHIKEKDHAKGIDIDFGGKYKGVDALLTWKYECAYDDALFLGAKRYMEHIYIKDEKTTNKDGSPLVPFWDVKCAGLGEKARKVITEKEHFAYWDLNTDYDNSNIILDSEGFPVDSKGKRIKGLYKTLKLHTVKNGALLLDTCYKITDREFIGIN